MKSEITGDNEGCFVYFYLKTERFTLVATVVKNR